MLGIDKVEIRESEKSVNHFIEGRFAEIYIEDSFVGLVGEIHPRILRAWKIKMPVALLEINLKKIFEKLN